MLSPERMIEDLLATNQTLAYEAAIVISMLLEQREALIREQIKMEMEFARGQEVWTDTSQAMLKALKAVDPTGENRGVTRAIHTIKAISKKLLPG